MQIKKKAARRRAVQPFCSELKEFDYFANGMVSLALNKSPSIST